MAPSNSTNNNEASTSEQQPPPPVAGPSVNKPVSIPIRDEPKVFFANERTFLSWLNFTVILVGFAIGLFNFGAADDRISRISAIMFISTAILIMLYSLYKFHIRAYKIRKRFMISSSNTTTNTAGLFYDDRVGPTCLCIILAIAMIVNYSCKYIYI
ncbi:hypothetical protein BDA99DRAFT_447421 [Phascolomyces articulosus]|uniref:DUF202 domain-containing protein n=1 Tax=Phascolomyces articulosus TaxID=60185 RepID=A0AAD5JN77_9FUNG|nr:hypothetical protein BDA99DRAFT_447421 [Phascolomyces articulosus]